MRWSHSHLTSDQLTMARSAVNTGVQLLSPWGFADVQISRYACQHPRGLPSVACFCPASSATQRHGATITTHPTQATAAHNASPARSERNSERIATRKRVKSHAHERQPDPLPLCLYSSVFDITALMRARSHVSLCSRPCSVLLHNWRARVPSDKAPLMLRC